MSHQESEMIVAVPLSQIEARLREVERWPEFLTGLVEVSKISHERYRFLVRQGSRIEELSVAVCPRPRDHRIVWRALTGPRWDGEIRLTEIDRLRTRVSLSITIAARGFAANLTELLTTRPRDEAVIDLQRLEDLVHVPVRRPAARQTRSA